MVIYLNKSYIPIYGMQIQSRRDNYKLLISRVYVSFLENTVIKLTKFATKF